MTDDFDRFDELLRDAALTYNRPPHERDMPLDAMWASIEAEVFQTRRRVSRSAQWLRIAAALVIGVGIGRLSFAVGDSAKAPTPTALSPATTQVASEPAQTLDPTTSRYLGQAAALLIALPTDANVHPDQAFMNRANDLLLTTRLLLDSPSGSDPTIRNLLEDLELVLVQVVRLQKEREPARRTELELIQQALDQRDVIPRLRNAVSDYAADD